MEKRNIKIGNKNVKFSYDGPLKAKEVVAIEAYIKGAHELAEKSIALINDEKVQDHFESIFGEAAAFKQKELQEAYLNIAEKIESGDLSIVRSKQFVSKARKFEPETFSSADPKDGKTIKIYDAFFEEHKGDDKGLNDRSSVIMHEVAHLVGLTGDCETDSIKSLECLRNFTILACGIVTPEDLFTGEDESEETEEETKADKNSKVGINGDLPFNSDQPRQPKGQSNGGQFAPKDGGAADGSASEENSAKTQKPDQPKKDSGCNTPQRLSEEKSNKTEKKPDEETDPISPKDFFRNMDFDPNGSGEKWVAAKNPIDALSVPSINKEAHNATKELFPNQKNHNNDGDAFRHAYFNYRLSEKIGSSEAKKFADGHEITSPNDPSETAMDLMNNKIGRELYDKNQTKGEEEARRIIMDALKNGLLRTKPYDIKSK